MNREDNPEYYEHLCNVIYAVFRAENKVLTDELKMKAKRGEISIEDYIHLVADELLANIDKEEFEKNGI